MTSIRTHLFQPDETAPTWNGEPICAACPLPKGHEIHKLPAASDAVREVEARRLGENGNSD